MKDLKPVRVFLKVAELSSFSDAARVLGMTPASVTRIVAKLEADLGQQLLLRTTRAVSLTTAGALVAARYRPVLEQFDRVTDEVTRTTMPDSGHLSINAPISLGLRLLPDLIVQFRTAYPDISLDVKMTDALVDIMQDDCDLAIRISSAPRDLSTIWRKICEVPRTAIAARGLFEHSHQPLVPGDLPIDMCLSYSATQSPETWEFHKASTRRRVRAGTRVVSNNGDFLYEMVLAGSGIAVLPDFIANQGLAAGRVVRVLPDWAIPSLWLTLSYPPYDQLPPLVATFSEFFETYMRATEGLDFSRSAG